MSINFNGGEYYIQDTKHGKFLVAGDNFDGNVYHQEHHGRPNAVWHFLECGDGYYFITDKKHQKELFAGDTKGKINHKPHGHKDQAKWKLTQELAGVFSITEKKSGKGIVAGEVFDGQVYHQEPNGRPVGLWRLIPAAFNQVQGANIDPGHLYNQTFILIDNKHKLAVMSPEDAAKQGEFNHNQHENKPNAKWKFVDSGFPGYYYIQDQKHHKYICAGEVYDGKVYLQDHRERNNARWKVENAGPGLYYIKDKKHDKCLQATEKAEHKVRHDDGNGKEQAKWMFIPTQ